MFRPGPKAPTKTPAAHGKKAFSAAEQLAKAKALRNVKTEPKQPEEVDTGEGSGPRAMPKGY